MTFVALPSERRPGEVEDARFVTGDGAAHDDAVGVSITPRTRLLAHGREVTGHDAQVQVLHLVASAQRRGAEFRTPSTVVVLSSRTEGLPGVLREAALTGLPLVATDVGGVNLIVDESTGRLVPADVTVEQLAAAITTVAADGDRLGAAARRRVLERFTIEPIADQWADLLGDVTGS